MKDILTSAKFGNNTTHGVKKCENKKCGVCDILIEGNHYKFKNTSTPFEIRKNLTCNSKNVVYVMECSNCAENYIGCTQALNYRVALHKSNIKIADNRYLNVSKHIATCGNAKFKVMPILQTTNYTSLYIIEGNLISKYKPSLNKN